MSTTFIDDPEFSRYRVKLIEVLKRIEPFTLHILDGVGQGYYSVLWPSMKVQDLMWDDVRRDTYASIVSNCQIRIWSGGLSPYYNEHRGQIRRWGFKRGYDFGKFLR